MLRSSPPLRARLLALCLAAAALPVASPGWAEARHYDIPAGPLDSALSRFAAASGVMISFGSTDTAGLRSAGLQGSYELEEGFALLLRGSDLQVLPLGDGRYVLSRPTADSSALELGALNVSANGLGARTEGSGAYTTGVTSTATKLALSLRETPQSVSVMTRQRMDDQGLTDLTRVLSQVTGVTAYDGLFANKVYFSRGFNLSENLKQDGMKSDSFASDMLFYDRVEVLRGASGLMSGSGNPSGIVNMVRKRPTEQARVAGLLRYGRWDSYRSELDASAPLTADGSLRGRFAIAEEEGGSFKDGIDAKENRAVYGILEWQPSERTTLATGLTYQKQDIASDYYGMPYLWADGGRIDWSRSQSLNTGWSRNRSEDTTWFVDLEQQLAERWVARMAAARTWTRIDNPWTYAYGAFDRSSGDGVDIYWGRQQRDIDVDSLDLNLSGSVELFGREHQLVLGADGSNKDIVRANYAGTGSAPINVYRFRPSDIAEPNWHSPVDSEESEKERALYLATRWSLAEPLHLILGARSVWWRGNEQRENGELVPYAGLVYDLNDAFSVYVSYADVFDPQMEKSASGVLEPIVGVNQEIGIKGEFQDGRLNASLALFRNEEENRAIRDRSIPFDTGNVCQGYCYLATGLIRSEGLDSELSGALTDNWQMTLGYTYTKTRYIRDEWRTGKAQGFVPRHLLRLWTSYSLPGDWQRWKVGGGITAQSDTYEEEIGDVQQSGYYLLNLMAQYQINEQLALEWQGNNLLDRKYLKNLGYAGGGSYYGEPRSMSLALKASF